MTEAKTTSKRPFKIIKNAYIWLGIAGVLFLAGILGFAMNAKYSEEFTGGVSLTIDKELTSETNQAITSNLEAKGYKDVNVSSNIE